MARALIEKSWGREELITNESYCMKLLVYTRRIASSLHYHERKHETFFVSSGVFELERWGNLTGEVKSYMRLVPGDRVILPPRTPHRIRCEIEGLIVEASTRDDPDDCVRIERSET